MHFIRKKIHHYLQGFTINLQELLFMLGKKASVVSAPLALNVLQKFILAFWLC